MRAWMKEKAMEELVRGPYDVWPSSHIPTFGPPVGGVAYEKRLAAYAVIRVKTWGPLTCDTCCTYWTG